MNYELNDLIENADIVRFIKSRKIAWLCHVMWMDDKRTPKIILKWKSIGMRIRWILENQNELRTERSNRKRRQSKIYKKQKNSLARSRDVDG